MKLLLINQHTSNHGDESAGKALLKKLINDETISEVNVIYNTYGIMHSEKFNVDTNKKISHHCTKPSTIDKALILLTFVCPRHLLLLLLNLFGSSGLKREVTLMENADSVVGAPGGVNLGPYKDWLYLWRIFTCVKLGKKVGIYSISFGPLPDNVLFKRASLYVLKNVTFLSLRDQKSQDDASRRGIRHIPAIDTAFLDNHFEPQLPQDISSHLDSNYAVFVPNQLYAWHPQYREVEPRVLDSLYISLMDALVQKYNQVILLPQLFGKQNDAEYFESLRKETQQPEKVSIIPDHHDSDIQQLIVKDAAYVVGARYHSIIFAVRNGTPFTALSYEHKIEYTLELLGLKDRSLNLVELLASEHPIRRVLANIEEAGDHIVLKRRISAAQEEADRMAQATFSEFTRRLLVQS